MCACSGTVKIQHGTRVAGERLALLPLVNASDSARADEAARSILATALHARGVKRVVVVARAPPSELLSLDDRRGVDAAIAAARKDAIPQGLTGSVNEWRYRPSDGRPAVGVSLEVIDLSDRRVLWTASGARLGATGATVSGTAQHLVAELLEGLRLE